MSRFVGAEFVSRPPEDALKFVHLCFDGKKRVKEERSVSLVVSFLLSSFLFLSSLSLSLSLSLYAVSAHHREIVRFPLRIRSTIRAG